MALKPVKKGLSPETWASLRPFGLGLQKPNNFAEVFRAIAENRDNLAYAWRILSQGVCDGCALGTSGLRDWTISGLHLCNIRLRLLRLNTMGPLDGSLLADVSALRSKSSAELRALGRLPYPLYRRKGEPGFTRISWDEALDRIALRMCKTPPEKMGFYLTSRGLPNETYYVVQKAVRALGCNNIDNAARICHSPSTVALKESLGVAATTCSYRDLIGTDLVVFLGSNPAVNQPVMMKYLYYAKKAGTQVVCVNPYREPAMERYWVPSDPESAFFGTKIADRFFLVVPGGDAAFLVGVLRHLIEQGWLNEPFIEAHTTGFEAVRAQALGAGWAELERLSGASRQEMLEFALLLAKAKRAVLVWSMGLTQHTRGEEAVQAVINLALSRGYLGREGCGLMPIRGHSGVQGGAEMGAYATVFLGCAHWAAKCPGPFQPLGLLGAGPPRPHRHGDARGRPGGSLEHRGEFLGNPAQPGPGRGLPSPHPPAGAPGHRPFLPDVDRTSRGGLCPPGHHPLRDSRGLHRDQHRAAGHLQPGNPRPPHPRGSLGGAGFSGLGGPDVSARTG